MENKIKYPPIEYLFFDHEQPHDEAWDAIDELSEEWNETKKNKFVNQEAGEISIILENGIQDAEYPLLSNLLENLKEKYNIVWFLGAVDNRIPEDYENAPYIRITGDAYPDKFIVNLSKVISSPKPCKGCHNIDIENVPVTGELIIDESYLDKQVISEPQFKPPGLDLINLPNGALLISIIIANLLKQLKISGYELIPVLSKQTKKHSDRIWLLKAGAAHTRPCSIHTPTTKDGICAICGKILGGILGDYYVREEWLSGDQIFARNSNLFSSIYVSHELYHAIKKMKAQGVTASYGIEKCSHLKK